MISPNFTKFLQISPNFSKVHQISPKFTKVWLNVKIPWLLTKVSLWRRRRRRRRTYGTIRLSHCAAGKKLLKCWQLTEISCQLNTIVLKRPCKPDQSKDPVYFNTSFSCNISLQRFQFCDSVSVNFQQALIFSFIRFACALIECLLKAFDHSLSKCGV